MARVPTSLADSKGLTLRAWQSEAANAALAWWTGESPPWAVIHAVMGAGKTHLTGLLCETWRSGLGEREHVVVVVPSRSLVTQTAASLRASWCGSRVGVYYSRDKQIADVIVTTYDSASKLSEQIQSMRRTVVFTIADECHQSQNPRGHAALKALGCPLVLGLSATPYRARRSDTLELFDRQIYKYGPADALRDGIIVPFHVVPADSSFETDETDDVCVRMVADAVTRGPTLANAMSIDDAEAFAARLCDEGFRAAAVHSRLAGTVADKATPLGRRIHQLMTGRLQVLVYPTLLSEGVDLPALTCIVARRPISSRVRAAQEWGRALRAHRGKRCAWIYDPHDLCHQFSIDNDAMLGWVEPDPEAELHAALDVDDDRERAANAAKQGELFSELPPARKLDVATAFVRRLAVAWRQTGRLRRMSSAPWRRAEATPRHCEAVARAARYALARHGDSPYRALMDEAVRRAQAGELDRGTTTDLLEILGIVHRAADIWPWEPT